jgi:hypothetical protein
MQSKLLLVLLYFFYFFLPVAAIIGLCVAAIIQQARKRFSYFRLFSHIGWLLIGIALFSLFIAFTSPPRQKELLLTNFGQVAIVVILMGSLLNVPWLWDTIIKMRLKGKKRSKETSL